MARHLWLIHLFGGGLIIVSSRIEGRTTVDSATIEDPTSIRETWVCNTEHCFKYYKFQYAMKLHHLIDYSCSWSVDVEHQGDKDILRQAKTSHCLQYPKNRLSTLFKSIRFKRQDRSLFLLEIILFLVWMTQRERWEKTKYERKAWRWEDDSLWQDAIEVGNEFAVKSVYDDSGPCSSCCIRWKDWRINRRAGKILQKLIADEGLIDWYYLPALFSVCQARHL